MRWPLELAVCAAGRRAMTAKQATGAQTWHARAPGKVVLMGDYVVLEGAPAIAAAVPQQALAAYSAGDGRGLYEVSADTLPDTFACSLTDEASRMAAHEASPQPLKLVVEVLLAAHRDSGGRLPPGALRVGTADFFADGHKLGLGSSAAALVATARVLLEAANAQQARTKAPPIAWSLADLVRLHRAWQGGSGSGIDVAVSHLGGIVRFSLGEAPRGPIHHDHEHDLPGPVGLDGQGPAAAGTAAGGPDSAAPAAHTAPTTSVPPRAAAASNAATHAPRADETPLQAHSLPAHSGPLWAVVAVGGQSSTKEALVALAALKAERPATYWHLFEQLAHLSHAACEFWPLGARVAFLPLVTEARRVLGELGDAMGWPIVTPIHREVAAAVSSLGGAYKPAGAGGQDVGVAFFASEVSCSKLRRALRPLGARVVVFAGQKVES